MSGLFSGCWDLAADFRPVLSSPKRPIRNASNWEGNNDDGGEESIHNHSLS
jgi:hypothetical protein